jgi:hypothetical protein
MNGGGIHRGRDVVGGVGRADEAGLVERRGDVHAAVEQAVEQRLKRALSVRITCG